MNGLNDITSGLSGIGTSLGANFAQDPAKRQYYQGQQQVQQQEEAAQRQALFQQHMESFENFQTMLSDPRAAQDFLTNPQGPTRRVINQWAQIFKAQADDPTAVDQMLEMLEVSAQFPQQAEAGKPEFKNVIGANGENLGTVNANDPNAMASLPQGARLAEAVGQSYTDDQFQQRLDLAQAGRSQTTVQAPDLASAERVKGQTDVQKSAMLDLQKSAQSSWNVRNVVARMRDITAQGFEGGWGRENLGQVGNILGFFGLDQAEANKLFGTTDTGTFKKLSADLVYKAIGSLGVGISDADRRFIIESLPSATTPAGVTALVLDHLDMRAKQVINTYDQAWKTWQGGGDPISVIQQDMATFGGVIPTPDRNAPEPTETDVLPPGFVVVPR